MNNKILFAIVLAVSGCFLSSNKENPFIGDWKLEPDISMTVRDSIYRYEFHQFMRSKGYAVRDSFPFNYPPPDTLAALVDEFGKIFECKPANCDSVLWVRKNYLKFTENTVIIKYLKNDILESEEQRRYSFDDDSIYTISAEIKTSIKYELKENGNLLETEDIIGPRIYRKLK